MVKYAVIIISRRFGQMDTMHDFTTKNKAKKFGQEELNKYYKNDSTAKIKIKRVA